jgi:hypothetical protein
LSLLAGLKHCHGVPAGAFFDSMLSPGRPALGRQLPQERNEIDA